MSLDPNDPSRDPRSRHASRLPASSLRTDRSRRACPAVPPTAANPVLSMGGAIDAAASGRLGDGRPYLLEGASKLRKLLVIHLGVDIDPDLIDLDLDYFDALVGTRRVTEVPSPYPTAGAFARDRARARSILRQYAAYVGLSKTPTVPLLGNHDECLLALQAAHRAGEINLGNKDQKLISVRKVFRIAAAEERPVHAMARHWFLAILEASSSADERTALRDCAKLLDRARSIASLAPLLPRDPISPLPARSSIRVTGSSIPTRLRAEMDDVLAERGSGGGPPELQRRLGVRRTKKTINGERTGLNWYVQTLQSLNLIRPSDDFNLVEIARRDWLDRAAKAELLGTVPWRPVGPQTLHSYVSAVERCLVPFDATLKGFAGQFQKENDFFRGIRKMTLKNQAACLRFVRSEELQRRYFELPAVLFAEAKQGFVRWPTATEKERTDALHQAVVAVVASILTAVPVRRGSLLQLAPFGDRPNLHIRKGMIELDLEPHHVKNRTPIERQIRDRPTHSPAKIISWFLGEPRRVLLDTMTSPPNPDLLFCDMRPDRLTKMWQGVLARHGLPMHLHLTRHLLASWFLHRDPNSLPMAAASLAIRRSTAESFYAFVHTEALAKRADAMLDNALELLFPDPDAST